MTDRYPAVARVQPRRLDPPPPLVLDAAETPRERERRLDLARVRFIYHERERARGLALARADERGRPSP